MASSDLQHDDISLVIGKPQSRIRRVKGNQREQVRAWMGEISNLSDDLHKKLLLRAFLSIRENPPPNILQAPTISGALIPTDILGYSRRLSICSEAFEASQIFLSLGYYLQERMKAQVQLRMINSIVLGICKWMNWVESKQARLTAGTEIAVVDLINLLIQKIDCLQKAKGSKRLRIGKNITHLTDLLLELAVKSNFAETFLKVMGVLKLIGEKISSSIFEKMLEEATRYQLFEQLIERIPIYSKKFLDDGRVDKIRDLAMVVPNIMGADSRFKAFVEDFWKKGGEKLPDEVRKFIRGYLGIIEGTIPMGIVLADESEGFHIFQLATALLLSWEACADSPKAAEAFNVFKLVAKNFFNIRISEEVGNIVTFDPKLHEIPGTSIEEGQVRVLRPWIEWSEGSKSRVLIRAIVEEAAK